MNFPNLLISVDTLAAWLVTFFIHSSLLLLGALLFTKFLAPKAFQLQEIAWKAAIVLGFFTASLQLGLHFSPTKYLPQSQALKASPAEQGVSLVPMETPFSLTPPETDLAEPEVAASDAFPAVQPPLALENLPRFKYWQTALVLIWLAGALFLLARFATQLVQLQRLLKTRTPLRSGALYDQLQAIRKSAGHKERVRLSVSDRIKIPIAFGLFHSEICVPRQAVTKLGPGQQKTMLAHELAHLIHRDPHWLRLVHLIQAVFFIQPLFRYAQRQLDLLAEIRCDDWAVQNLGQPRELAQCLAEVAGWSLNTKRHLPVPGMAKGGSILQKRVERLLSKNHQVMKSQSWLMKALIIGGLSLMAMATPGLLPAEPVIAPAPAAPVAVAQAELPAPDQAPVVAASPSPAPSHTVVRTVSPAPQPQPLVMATPEARAVMVAAPAPQAAPAPRVLSTAQIAKSPKPKYGGWGDRKDYKRHKETRELVIDAPSRLIVDGGQNGGISVKGWNRPDVKIVAKVTAYTEDASDAEALFNDIQVIAEDRIYAEGPKRGGWSVSFEISAPFQTDVDLETHNGGISLYDLSGTLEFKALNGGVRLAGLSGDVRGKTTNGGLKVTLDGEQWDGSGLDVKTTNGGVSLEIPEGYNAELHTGTVNGRMDFQFPVMVKGNINKNFKTTLGEGGPLVRVKTTNGSVRVTR